MLSEAFRPRTFFTAAAIVLIVGAAAVFAYLEATAHIRYVRENQQPSFHHIYQFREHQLRLITALTEYLHEPAAADHDALMLRFDVLWSRVDPMLSGETAALLGDINAYRGYTSRIKDLLEEIDPLILDLKPGDPATTALIIGKLDQMLEPYETIRRNMQGNADLRRDEMIGEAKRFGYIQMGLLSLSLLAAGVLCFLVLRQAQRAQILASHDPLTGLLNRSQLGVALDCSERTVDGEPTMVALHCIDLDRFKSINDTLGHPVGDKLLQEVGKRFSTCIRASDTIIRLGGDEFAIVQPGLARLDQAESLASRLVQAGAEPFEIDGHMLMTGVSVGCAVYPRDADTVGGLIEKADLALYEAKKLGRRTFSFFEKSLEDQAVRQRYLEAELRKALDGDQLQLYFQPKYRLRDQRLIGAEALIRWRHPDHGLISPAEFIPVAEECGLIAAIGAKVLETACKEASHWRRLSSAPLQVAVNLSAVQFERQNIAAVVSASLDKAGLDARLLDVEITERLLLKDNDDVKKQIDNLRSIGVSLSLDDFGTGYSSISYLRQFSFDRIKIDKSFVEGLGSVAETRPLIEAIVHLAHGFDIEVVAEGVETEIQLRELVAIGCDEAQGFYLGHPMPAAEFRTHVGAAPAIIDMTGHHDKVARLTSS